MGVGYPALREGRWAMGEQDNRRVAFETARLKLARVRLSAGKALDTGFRLVTQVAADALQVERVGIWMFESAHRRLACQIQFNRSQRRWDEGPVLQVEQYPNYFAVLEQCRALPVDDARSHPATAELRTRYLEPNGIVSMLDAPIIREGRVVGVICHETVDVARHWTQAEIDFAGSAADIAALIFEQAERVELEAALKLQSEQRLESEKLEALGRLARNVAHDLNNLLTVVLGVAHEACQGATDECRQLGQTLKSGTELGQRLVNRLFELGRREADVVSPVDLATVLRAMAPALRTLLGAGPEGSSGVDLQIRIDGGPFKLLVARDELEQTVLNLVVNARDAVTARAGKRAGRGRIEVRLREPGIDDELPGDRVVLEVSDDGIGMDAHTRAHLFEPYFTTKPSGNGLGLAIVYAVVKRAGGTIQVASEQGRGSVIQVVLPRHRTQPEAEAQPEDGDQRRSGQ